MSGRRQLLNILLMFMLFQSVSGRAVMAAEAPLHFRLALNWKPEPQFGGFYAAELQNHYAKNGVDVQILPGGAGTPVVQMVAAGQVDFGIASADEVVLSRAAGSDVVALFAVYQTNPQGIMTHAERGFKTLSEVYKSPGVLAVQKGLPYEKFLEKKFAASKTGASSSGIQAQLVPYQGGIGSFLADARFSQQCFVTSEPLAAEKRGVKARTFLIADEGFNPYTTVLITRRELINKNPKAVRSMVQAVREGWREYLDHPDKTNLKMSGMNKAMDLKTFSESAAAQKSLILLPQVELGSMTEVRWQTLIQQLKALDLIKVSPKAVELFL